jgi:hypothetical protein
MQHLFSKYREEDVEYEVQTEDLLLRRTEGIDVGSVAERIRFRGFLSQKLVGWAVGWAV